MILRPVWAMFWVHSIEEGVFWAKVFFAFNFLSALLALLSPSVRLFRVMAFLGLFFFSAAMNSDLGGRAVQVVTYQFPLVAFIFLFFPVADDRGRRANWRRINVMILAQIAALAPYATSGLWRFREALEAWVEGRPGPLEWNSLAHIMMRWEGLGEKLGIISDYFFSQQWLTGPGLLVMTALELLAVFVMLRPAWYRLYGIFAVFFHLGIFLVMDIRFNEQLLLVMILLVCNPLGFPGPRLKFFRR